jgi:tetratricopeptide (TPR) repeat protein
MAASPVSQAKALFNEGRADEAEPLLRKHLRKKPRDMAAIETLGLIMAASGRLAEMAQQLIKAAQTPIATAQCIHLACDGARAHGNHAVALAMARIATTRFGDLAESWRLQGREELATADAFAASKSLARAHELNPTNDDILGLLADADASKGTFPVPEHWARIALERNPGDPRNHVRIGNAQRLNDDLPAAHASFTIALQLDAESPTAIAGMAETLESMGDTNAAVATLQPAIAKGEPGYALVTAWARITQRAGALDKGIATMERYLAARRGSPWHTSNMLMQLGRAYDKADRTEDAFRSWVAGNQAHKGRWNKQAHESLIEQLEHAFGAACMTTTPRSTIADPTPIFIVGMFRSGTTLTEQVLCAHPAIEAVGESPALPESLKLLAQSLGGAETWPACIAKATTQACTAAGQAYIDRVRAHSPTGDRLVDKLPMNYLSVGAIPLVVPNAKIVHLTRDPMDTGLSCFSQAFASRMAFTADLDDLGHAIAMERRIMRHWASLGINIHTVQYETLAANPEAVIRALLAFLDLPWHADVMNFHTRTRVAATPSMDQVRTPINTKAVGRAARFGKQLDPLRKAFDQHSP